MLLGWQHELALVRVMQLVEGCDQCAGEAVEVTGDAFLLVGLLTAAAVAVIAVTTPAVAVIVAATA